MYQFFTKIKFKFAIINLNLKYNKLNPSFDVAFHQLGYIKPPSAYQEILE